MTLMARKQVIAFSFRLYRERWSILKIVILEKGHAKYYANKENFSFQLVKWKTNFILTKIFFIIIESKKNVKYRVSSHLTQKIASFRCGIACNKRQTFSLGIFPIVLGSNPKTLEDCVVFAGVFVSSVHTRMLQLCPDQDFAVFQK